ncbi:MAG: GntR family transcriptional regulator [Terrimicrobiaceae bacterium]
MTLLQQSALMRSRNLLGALRPGQFLPAERELAAAADVGRSVIRGLCRTLEAQGLIASEGRRWRIRRALPLPRGVTTKDPPLSKRELVKNHLITELGSGGLWPGQQLSELSLSRRLDVSTVTVREALLELQPLGVITKNERRQWEVIAMTKSKIGHLREFRELVEIFALRKLFTSKLREVLREALEGNLRKTGKVLADPHARRRTMLEVDMEFHRLLLQASGNPLLQERSNFIYIIIEFQLSNPRFNISRAKLGMRQHQAILKAILADDLPDAERHLRAHLQAADESFIALAKPLL